MLALLLKTQLLLYLEIRNKALLYAFPETVTFV